MKRRQRRPVLDINNGEQSESSRGRWQSKDYELAKFYRFPHILDKYQQIAVDHPEQNGPNNPLASLLGEYNSDSESEDIKQDSTKLSDKVNDFLKELQMIVPNDNPKANHVVKATEPITPTQGSRQPGQNETSSCSWQECYDETTGYPYYWHIKTNKVTWEMPSEMKLHGEKCSKNRQIQTPQTHPTHTPVQWANFLPNTYPELQTNIPEGMIPKEVVARNRNRQVGLTRDRSQESEITAQAPKKIRSKDDDSDNEKIEMITSFGNDESESDTSDNESPVKTSSETTAAQRVKKSNMNTFGEKNCSPEENDSLSIGPLLQPGIVPMVHGPENVSLDMRHVLENHKIDITPTSNITNPSTRETESNSNVDTNSIMNPRETQNTDNTDDEDILKRLKNQAKLLQTLGGEVPESVETLIKNDKEEGFADDIISQIEKEMPVDYPDIANSDDKIRKSCAGMSENNKELIKYLGNDRKNKEFKISLVAGYSDDSDVEEESSPKKTNVAPLFPISDYIVKDNSNSIINSTKVFEDTNLLGELSINDGVLKSFEVNPRQVPDDVELSTYNEEIERKVEKGSERAENPGELDIIAVGTTETEEFRIVRPEAEPSKQQSFLESLEVPAKGFQRKRRIAFDVVPNMIRRPLADGLTNTTLKTDPLTLSFVTTMSGDNTKRPGFGFHEEQQLNIESEESLSQNMNIDKSEKERGDRELKKCVSFVKGETASFKTDSTVMPDETLAPSDGKQLKELTEIVMEKVKFLSEGSQSPSAIQIMVIQLQTLVGAWEAGDLKERYLFEWLKVTGHELGRLEQAAAPPGWDCHWDRSHKRYYYRNSITGEAQWTYPEADVVGGTEEMDLCTTPPPPDHEEPQIIEEPHNEAGPQKAKVVDAAPTIVMQEEKSVVAIGINKIQITKDEYTGPEAPPPPQISSPSPPPPPRIFAQDLKKGKKRRGSSRDRSIDPKKEKTEATTALNTKDSKDPPLPSSPPKNSSQPPLPPNSPQAPILPNPMNSEPLPPGVDPKDMPYSLRVTTLEPSVVYATSSQQTNPIYAATIGDRTVPIIDHRSAIIQGQLMHYPTYHHLHNQALIAAAGSLTGQEAVQFIIPDYSQVYANNQVIAKPPIKCQNETLGSALDSFYSDIASIEKTNAEQESTLQDFQTSREATPPPPTVNSATASTEVEQINTYIDPAGKEKKKKKSKISIGKKQKEMSTMVAKWQRAQQDFDDTE